MPSPTTIIRLRRNRSLHAGRIFLFGKWITGVISMLVVAFLGVAFLVGLIYAQLVKDLPPVGNIEVLFSKTASGFLEPVHVYDRSKVKMFDLVHPLSSHRRWMELGVEGEKAISEDLQNAIVASQDKSFWSNHGYDPELFVNVIFKNLWNSTDTQIPKSITQQLVEMTILPAEDFIRSEAWRYLREAILAERLTERYSKKQIFEWYINSIGFGRLTYGIDAAALVYFDKHAHELSLAECALLAAVSSEPKIDLFTSSASREEAQKLVLQAMRDAGWITERQFQRASIEDVQMSQNARSRELDLQEYTLTQMAQVLGIASENRAGLHVFTTIDNDLQLQVDCMIEIFLDRLKGRRPDSGVVMADGMECPAARLLPPLRPGEEGMGNGIHEVASIILDPVEGEILSYHGSARKPMPSTSMLYPFVYLTAFSRGNSPGTMVLDLPADDVEETRFERTIPHGPVSMRTALAGGYPFAAQRTIRSSGPGAVIKVLEQMGVAHASFSNDAQFDTVFPERYEISLLDTVYGYGVLANSGKMVGVSHVQPARFMWRSLDPILIKKVMGDDGTSLYQAEQGEQLILSQELAFLITHVLKDTAARELTFRPSNIFELYRPFAVMNGTGEKGDLSWTIGYSPSHVVGVWLEDREEEAGEEAINQTTALSLWRGLSEFVSQDLPIQSWEMPSGIVEVDICKPSGLLPTDFCPNVVEELFLKGTEPIHYDTLYKPYQVNKETGRLATLSTPLDQVEEEIYFVAPAEVVEWAQEAGYPQPPNEYDSLDIKHKEVEVKIDFPRSFESIGGVRWISGRMNVEDFRYYRMVYGSGLNPTRWFQMGEDIYKPVAEGTLALWDTRGLDGLYALQLMVVDQDGIVRVATQYVVIDNQPPDIILVCPNVGDPIPIDQGQPTICDAEVRDNLGISKVEFYLDGKRISTDFNLPFSVVVSLDQLGESELIAHVYDLAGNSSESEPVRIVVVEE